MEKLTAVKQVGQNDKSAGDHENKSTIVIKTGNE